MSFVDKDDIQDIVEALLRYSWPEDRPPIETPFPRMKYKDAIANYGSDKPDTRFDMQVHWQQLCTVLLVNWNLFDTDVVRRVRM